jgi:hypothetical protein
MRYVGPMTNPQSLTTTKSYAEIKATRKMRWWYEHLADYLIAHPDHTQNDAAAHFGRSPSTISVIINSDAFQAYLRQRRTAYVEALDSSVRTKMLKVADRGFDLILDKFDKKRDSIPLESLTKTIEVVTKAAGMHSDSRGGVQVNVNAPGQQTLIPVSVSLADLQEAQQALRNAQRLPSLPEAPEPIEGEFTEVTAATAEDLA